jgi:RHS repeat-associated protein
VISYQYNSLNRLTQVQHLSPSNAVTPQFDYLLADTGHRLKITELNGRTSDYQYDEMHRLLQEAVTDATLGNRTTDYTYDTVGNRLTQTENGVSTSYTYSANDHLLETNNGSVITSYLYDANGNTTQKNQGLDVTAYAYSQDNRMVRAITATDVVNYDYDARGTRQSKTVNGLNTDYLVDQNRPYAQVLSELDETGTANTVYTYGDDLVSQTRNSQSHYYLYDGLGSTRGLSDQLGNVTDSYSYKAFGELENQTGSTLNLYQFAGEQLDLELGKYYLRARYMSPSDGRFNRMDTWLGYLYRPLSLNKYSYAEKDPVNNVDPSGHYITLMDITASHFEATYARVGYARKAYGKFYQIRELLCKNPAAVSKALNGHHSLPKFGGGPPNQGKLLSDIPEDVHIAFHRLLHYALMINGFTAPSTKTYKSLFMTDRTNRADFLRILRNVTGFVDTYCVGVKGIPITPKIRKVIKAYGYEF